MHAKAEPKLAGRVKAVIACLRVDEDQRLDSLSAIDQLDGYISEVLKQAGQWLREVDAWSLLWRGCYRAVHAAREISKPIPPSRLLRDWIGIEESDRICESVLATLRALPITYTAYVRLPQLGLEENSHYELANGVWLLRSEDMADPEIQAAVQDGSSHLGASARHAEAEPVYLACQTQGYYAPDAASSAASRALSLIKQVLYLAELTEVLGFARYTKTHLNEPAHLFVRQESSAEFERPLKLPILAKVITDGLQFTETIFANRNRLDGQAPSKEIRIREAFKVASFCLGSPQEHTDILTAAEWAFDSSAEDNQTLSYLYAAIALEAILDAPDKEITSVLGDRLAYLIGASRSDRRNIRDTFKQFYQHRSKIVHGKMARLASEELKLLSWAKDAIRMAISRELALASR